MSAFVGTCVWKSKMLFEAKFRSKTVRMDARSEHGGDDSALNPKELTLAGICGCTGMDVVSILQKMRQPLTSLEIGITSEKTESPPVIFKNIHLTFDAKGEGLLPEKLKHAVELSQTKYCGVSAMIAECATITYEILLNGEKVGDGQSKFDLPQSV